MSEQLDYMSSRVLLGKELLTEAERCKNEEEMEKGNGLGADGYRLCR